MPANNMNRPLRVLERAVGGALGPGEVGLVMSRHGTGKTAVLTSIALDSALGGEQTLHVALDEAVPDLRAYHDEVLHAVIESLGLADPGEIVTHVERHKQIYSFRGDTFSLVHLDEILETLQRHAAFAPRLIELIGWPDFRRTEGEGIAELRSLAQRRATAVWCSAHTTRHDRTDRRGVPDYIAQIEGQLAVVIALEPEGDRLRLRFVKTHDRTPPEGLRLEFDPRSMLIRWS